MATFTEIDTIVDNLVIDLVAALGAYKPMTLAAARIDATTAGDADVMGGGGNQNLEKIGRYLLHKALVAQRRIDLMGGSGS